MMRLWGRKSSINVQKVLWCLAELGLEEGKDFERIDAGLHFGRNRTPEGERNYEAIRKAYQDSSALLTLLDQQLINQQYCSGNTFHIGDIPLVLCVSRWTLLNQTFPNQTGLRPILNNIDAWMKRIEEGTQYKVVAEKELNVIK